MATASKESANNGSTCSDDKDSSQDNFECNICLDKAKDAVISMCGHLFCWPCLHRWLETRSSRQVCPVCKAAINKDKVIPLYGRGGSQKDPREKLPPRPSGQRTEPTNHSGQTFSDYAFGDGGFHMSFGIGAFPFGFFTSSFNFGDGRGTFSTNDMAEEQILSKIFLFLAIFFIAWLLIV